MVRVKGTPAVMWPRPMPLLLLGQPHQMESGDLLNNSTALGVVSHIYPCSLGSLGDNKLGHLRQLPVADSIAPTYVRQKHANETLVYTSTKPNVNKNKMQANKEDTPKSGQCINDRTEGETNPSGEMTAQRHQTSYTAIFITSLSMLLFYYTGCLPHVSSNTATHLAIKYSKKKRIYKMWRDATSCDGTDVMRRHVTERTCMMKLTSSSVGLGVIVSSDSESVVPTIVAPSHGRKNRTLIRGGGGERGGRSMTNCVCMRARKMCSDHNHPCTERGGAGSCAMASHFTYANFRSLTRFFNLPRHVMVYRRHHTLRWQVKRPLCSQTRDNTWPLQ